MPRLCRHRAGSAWRFSALFLLGVSVFVPRPRAATVITGDVTPALPWSPATNPILGNTGLGTLAVDAGSQLTSGKGILGYLAGSTGTATIEGTGSAWNNNSFLSVGWGGNGTLSVQAGGKVTNTYGSVGETPRSSGTVTIAGAGSTWTNTAVLSIGGSGAGVLRVEAGGQVSNNILGVLGLAAGSTGSVTVAGVGSIWTNSDELDIGVDGNGALRVEAGGKVSNTEGYLGYRVVGTGTATVTGVGSLWTNSSELYVGKLGKGSLTVENGGRVTAATLYASLSDLHGNGEIAATYGGVVDADLQFNASHPTQSVVGFGTGGTLTVTPAGGVLGLGYKGVGSLTIAEGTTIASPVGFLGYNAGSRGTATITGAGSKWTNSSTLFAGNSGSGVLRVEAGAQVGSNTGVLGNNPGAVGTATISGMGSKWTTSSTLYVGKSGSGELHVDRGGQVSSLVSYLGYGSGSTGKLYIEAGGQVSNIVGYLGNEFASNGTAAITGSGSKWTNVSALSVGMSGSGTLTVSDGGLVSVHGALTIDLDGGMDSFVNMSTGGKLALYGNADDSLTQFLTLVAGTDAIRYWSDAAGGWAPLTGATLGVDYALEYLTTGDLAGFTLLTVGSIPTGPAGDFNGNGFVDGADFLRWQRGGSPIPGSADDLAAWQSNFGMSAAAGATTAVPEPGAFAQAALAAAALLQASRWRRGGTARRSTIRLF